MERLDREQFLGTLGRLLGDAQRIRFIPNPGNAGDGLIAAGMWQALEQCGRADLVDAASGDEKADVYLYPGGGNLIPEYRNARDAIAGAMAKGFDRLVVLPHTIRGHEDLLDAMDQRCHLFARDRVTHQHLLRHAPRAHVYLADDLALALDPAWILDGRRHLRNLASLPWQPRIAKRYLKWRRRIARIRPQQGRLTLMRVDVEARDRSPRDPALDLSACYGSSFSRREEAELIAHDFLRVLSRAGTVVSDRLHVGIGASLLGKQVDLRDNNYGKNRAIFELSMRERFPLTRFVEEPAA